jgi:hypothetical protein
MEAGVEFEAVDFSQANRLTIHILAAVAEHETKMISERTKAALQAAKRRGVKLGGFRAGAKLTAKARQTGVALRKARGILRAVDYAPVIAEIQATGVTSLAGIAAALNERGIPTASGQGTWQAVRVGRVLAWIEAADDREKSEREQKRLNARKVARRAERLRADPEYRERYNEYYRKKVAQQRLDTTITLCSRWSLTTPPILPSVT